MSMIVLFALLTVGTSDGKKPPTHSTCPWAGTPTAADAGIGIAVDGYTYRIGKKKHLIAFQGVLGQCKAMASMPALMQWQAAKSQLGALNRSAAAYAVKAGLKLANAPDEPTRQRIGEEMAAKAEQFSEQRAPLLAGVQEQKAGFFAALYATDSGN